MTVRFSSVAQLEILEAIEYYLSESLFAAQRFEQELEDGVRQIKESPDRYPRRGVGLRGKILTHFPFTILYNVSADEIVVVAIQHHAREPQQFVDRFQ